LYVAERQFIISNLIYVDTVFFWNYDPYKDLNISFVLIFPFFLDGLFETNLDFILDLILFVCLGVDPLLIWTGCNTSELLSSFYFSCLWLY
jgi:hypothetical protein